MVDHNPSSLTAVVDHLALAGHAAQVVADCEAARAILLSDRASLVLIGQLSGDISRADYCRDLRAIAPAGQTVIIVALPESASRTRIRCLEEGADDVIDAPIVPQRMLQRVRSLLSPGEGGYHSVLRYGAIVMSIDELKVRVGDTLIELSPAAFRLLRTFLEHPEQTLSRRDLMVSLGRRGGATRSIDSQVRRLRTAMSSAGAAHLIVTVSSVGYMLSGG